MIITTTTKPPMVSNDTIVAKIEEKDIVNSIIGFVNFTIELVISGWDTERLQEELLSFVKESNLSGKNIQIKKEKK